MNTGGEWLQVSGSGTSGCDGVRVSRPALSSVSSQDTYPGPSGQRLLRPQEDRDWTAWDRVAPMWRASGCLSGLNVLSTKKYIQDRTVTGTRRDERTVNPVVREDHVVSVRVFRDTVSAIRLARVDVLLSQECRSHALPMRSRMRRVPMASVLNTLHSSVCTAGASSKVYRFA